MKPSFSLLSFSSSCCSAPPLSHSICSRSNLVFSARQHDTYTAPTYNCPYLTISHAKRFRKCLKKCPCKKVFGKVWTFFLPVGENMEQCKVNGLIFHALSWQIWKTRLQSNIFFFNKLLESCLFSTTRIRKHLIRKIFNACV